MHALPEGQSAATAQPQVPPLRQADPTLLDTQLVHAPATPQALLSVPTAHSPKAVQQPDAHGLLLLQGVTQVLVVVLQTYPEAQSPDTKQPHFPETQRRPGSAAQLLQTLPDEPHIDGDGETQVVPSQHPAHDDPQLGGGRVSTVSAAMSSTGESLSASLGTSSIADSVDRLSSTPVAPELSLPLLLHATLKERAPQASSENIGNLGMIVLALCGVAFRARAIDIKPGVNHDVVRTTPSRPKGIRPYSRQNIHGFCRTTRRAHELNVPPNFSEDVDGANPRGGRDKFFQG
ncbi:MAG: hypothetical protein NVS3B20_02470 [Polyangiales bacterium]